MRLRYFLCASLAALILAGCGGGSSPAPGGSSSGAGVGSSSGSGATGGIGSSSSSGSNAVAVMVYAGPPAAHGGTFNIPYTSVTLCSPPGSPNCKLITDVVVDTGSSGLRIMASALAAVGLTPTALADPGNAANTIAECMPFADGYTWGPVAAADIRIGGELASSAAINIVDDDASYPVSAPGSCTGLGKSLNSVTAFDANGVLGVGVFAQDCGAACANCAGICSSRNDIYYSCSASSNTCAFTPMALGAQVANPVALFATDNDGVILTLPPLTSGTAPTASGSLIFGIATRSNNQLAGATIVTADYASGDFITIFNGQSSTSFFDSGSNALFFSDSSITICRTATAFYCPYSTLTLSATIQGQNGNAVSVPFQIANILNINHMYPNDYAIDEVGGTSATIAGLGSGYFDWGLPFFYGRSVYAAIEGRTAGGTPGPYYAYY